MTHILILEDQKTSREALVKILEDISDEITVSEAGTYAEADALLESGIRYDMFMLDINLDTAKPGDTSGITFAKKIRERRGYEFTPVIIITSIANLEMSAYREIHCYQYILKPFFGQDVEEVVRKVMRRQRQPERPVIKVRKDGINYRIYCDEIVYIKAIPRGVALHMRKDMMEVPYLSIRQLLEQLPADTFMQCHRMFVINIKRVKYLDLVNQMIRMEGCEETIDIGVTYKAEVRRRLNE